LHVCEGYLTEQEYIDFMSITSAHKNYYSPVLWAMSLARRARHRGLLESDHLYNSLLQARFFAPRF
jgi:hypothetical protein